MSHNSSLEYGFLALGVEPFVIRLVALFSTERMDTTSLSSG